MAVAWQVGRRMPSEDYRRGLFRRRAELLEHLDPAWAARFRFEMATLFREVGRLHNANVTVSNSSG